LAIIQQQYLTAGHDRPIERDSLHHFFLTVAAGMCQEQGYRGSVQHFVGNTTERPTPQPIPPMRCHHNQVYVPLGGLVDDRLGGKTQRHH
jgi:hypothetical protein